MIKINLIPEDYLKKKVDFKEIIYQYKALSAPVIGAVAGIVVIFVFFILFYPTVRSASLSKLKEKWSRLEPEYNKAEKIKEEEKKLKDGLKIVEYINSKRIIWAAKLNQISDALPPEIQLTELKLVKEKGKKEEERTVLVVSGIVPPSPGERAVEEFIKQLKANQDFLGDFPEIELPLTAATEEGFKKFILKCYLSEKYIYDEEKKSKKEDKGAGKKKKNGKEDKSGKKTKKGKDEDRL